MDVDMDLDMDEGRECARFWVYFFFVLFSFHDSNLHCFFIHVSAQT